MGIFDWFAKRPQITSADVPAVAERVAGSLGTQRDLFYAGALVALRAEGVDLSGVPPEIEEGGEVDSALRALQLVSVVGFCFQYLDPRDAMTFGESLASEMDNGDAANIELLREHLLGCEGDWGCLVHAVTDRIVVTWNRPDSTGRLRHGVGKGIEALVVMSQAVAAGVVGDEKAERRLKAQVGLA